MRWPPIPSHGNGRLLHLHAVPLLEPVCDPLGIRLVQDRTAVRPAGTTLLVVDAGVVVTVLVEPDGDGDLLAAPAFGFAVVIVTHEASHYMRVPGLHYGFVVVLGVFGAELAVYAFLAEQLRHFVMQGWI